MINPANGCQFIKCLLGCSSIFPSYPIWPQGEAIVRDLSTKSIFFTQSHKLGRAMLSHTISIVKCQISMPAEFGSNSFNRLDAMFCAISSTGGFGNSLDGLPKLTLCVTFHGEMS